MEGNQYADKPYKSHKGLSVRDIRHRERCLLRYKREARKCDNGLPDAMENYKIIKGLFDKKVKVASGLEES
jgi:hypothetical protein